MAVKKTTSTSRAAAKIANAIKAEPAKAAKTAAKAVKEEEKTAVKAEEKAEVKAAEKMLRAAFDGLQKKKVVENPNPNEKSESARTGDRMPIAGWLVAMVAATILFVKRKRSKN